MRRPLVLLAVLLAMLWQSLAMAGVGSTVNFLVDLEHAALHWHGEGHHHHDDGSYHLDDSKEAVQHVLADQVSSTTALLLDAPRIFAPAGSPAPGGQHEMLVPGPAPDGLLRPPRPHA